MSTCLYTKSKPDLFIVTRTPAAKAALSKLSVGIATLANCASAAVLSAEDKVWTTGYCSPGHQTHCDPSILE